MGFISGVAERDGWHEATFVLNTDKPLWDVARDLLRVGTPVSIGAKSLLRDESLADLGLATPVRRHTTAVLQEVSILSPGVMPGYKGAKIIRITERGTARDRMRERQLERERADAKLKARASASAWPPGTIVRDLGDGREEITYPNGGPAPRPPQHRRGPRRPMMAKTRGHLLVEQLQVPRTRQKGEPERFVGCACGRVARIAAGSQGRDIHSAPTHVVERVSRELRGDASPLEVGIHSDDLDHAHALVEGVEGDGDEPDWSTLRDRDEGVPLVARATHSHLLGLRCLPVGLQAKEDRVAQDVPQRGEDRIPCAKRELHDCVEVALMELSYLDHASHRCDKTLPSREGHRPGQHHDTPQDRAHALPFQWRQRGDQTRRSPRSHRPPVEPKTRSVSRHASSR